MTINQTSLEKTLMVHAQECCEGFKIYCGGNIPPTSQSKDLTLEYLQSLDSALAGHVMRHNEAASRVLL